MSLTTVSIVFYSTPKSRRGKLVQILQYNPIFHCGLMLSCHDESFVIASDKTHRAKFIPNDLYHNTIGFKPSHIVILGETDFSNIQRTMDFIATPYKGDTMSMAFWYYIGRFLFKSYQPKSCALLACQIARFCGFKLDDFILPKNLYNDLRDKYTHYTWEEYIKESEK